jgi:hypothetical protein
LRNHFNLMLSCLTGKKKRFEKTSKIYYKQT